MGPTGMEIRPVELLKGGGYPQDGPPCAPAVGVARGTSENIYGSVCSVDHLRPRPDPNVPDDRQNLAPFENAWHYLDSE